tara:strand:- start:1465 stop:2427 length:963 start_codon:yes stop_codon:yes gene_type:complete
VAQLKKTISICIPVYNEGKNLSVAVDAVESLFKDELSNYELEIIVTDNGSADDTWKITQNLANQKPYLKGYRFSRNFGYQNSVFAGLSMATGDAVIEMDADLEDPPHVIPSFVKEWEKGFDVVYGVRAKRYGSLALRSLFSVFYWLLNRISEQKIPRNAGDFRLLDRKVVDVLKALPERNLYLRGLVSFLGFKQTPYLYERQPRISGNSKFKFFHYVILAIDAITAFTKAPLRIIGALGTLLFFAAFGLGIYYLVSHLIFGVEVKGFTTLVILTLFLHSITFIFLGILGEYLSRIFDDSKNRPRIIFEDSINTTDCPKYL